MKPKRPNPWVQRRHLVLERGENLALRVSKELPVNLTAAAVVRRVSRLQFRPLLVDGATSVKKGGFSIYVKCGHGEADELNQALELDGTGKFLPEKMRNRARFTIAHEIAHTFFFNIREDPPQPKFDLDHPSTLQSLEYACNLGAGAVLLPRPLLSEELKKVDDLDPDSLRKIAEKALVSKQAFVERLKKLHPVPHPKGIVMVVERTSSECKIQSISRHYTLREVYQDTVVGSPLATLIRNPDFVLNGGDFLKVSTRSFEVCTEFAAEKRRTGTFIVTFRWRT